MKAILFARVSTNEQDTKPQLILLNEYAKGNFEYGDKDIYDFDESAFKEGRAKFDVIIDRLKSEKEKTAFICDKVDRLTRSATRRMPEIEDLRKSGKIEFHFPSEGKLILNDHSPASELFRFNIAVSLAQYYSDAISDNVKRSIYKRIKGGQILTKAPFGYRNIGEEKEDKTVITEPQEARVVLKMFEWYSTGAYSESQIKNKVIEEYGIKMAKSKVGHILSNKFYIGICYYRKKNIEYQHIYETIVPENLFNEVQNLKEGRLLNGNKSKYAGKPFYYRGLVRCAKCGCSLSPEEQRGKNYYCCTEYKGKHDAKYVHEEELTDKFAEIFKRITISEEDTLKVMSDLKKLNADSQIMSDDLIKNLRFQYDDAKHRQSKLYDDFNSLGTRITKDFYEEKWKLYQNQMDMAKEKIDRVEKVGKDFYLTAGYIIQLAKHSSELFVRSELEDRKLLIKTTLSSITWDGENLLYDYIFPFNLLADVRKSKNGVSGGRKLKQNFTIFNSIPTHGVYIYYSLISALP
jgi:DNA invertase Pin-like site-specific DNA recombinase